LFVAGGGIGIQLSGKVSKPHMICQLPDHQLAYMTSRSTDLRHLMREAISMPSERQSENFEIDHLMREAISMPSERQSEAIEIDHLMREAISMPSERQSEAIEIG